jgi:hypothetical protein
MRPGPRGGGCRRGGGKVYGRAPLARGGAGRAAARRRLRRVAADENPSRRCVAALERKPHDGAKGDDIWSWVDANGNY